MVKISELNFNREVFPLRLIDLAATLGSRGGVRFCVPDDWSFHAISHVWSQEICNLSVAVGKVVSQSGWTKEEPDLHARGLSYNQAFAKPQFAGLSCYEELMEFFRVLAADGASKVWFDALCINQTDDDEKSWEIGHMGAYYRLSAGCYVITHGIGSETGFKAANYQDPRGVPRWLTRAWTVQESILPTKLSFVVEKFDAKTTEFLKTWYENNYPSGVENYKQWIDWDEELESTATGDNSRRRACKEVYCLGAQAYRSMMEVALYSAWNWTSFRAAFGGLGDGISEIDVEFLVETIQRRDCSVEEDRVLCILGLLGITGEHQLRTKQTLDWQLVGLAKMLMKENPKLLVNLCAADFEGYGSPCISWLPDFRQAEYRRFVPSIRNRRYVVERYEASVEEVKEDGRIVLRARMLRGCLSKHWSTDYRLDVGALVIPFHHHFEKQAHLLPLEKPATNDGPGDSVQQSGGLSIPAPGIDKLHDHSCSTPLPICDISLLLLGHCDPSESPNALAMACVTGDDSKEMHKIGILRFSSLDAEHAFPSSSEDCLIGGFGDDLTCYLSQDCRAILVNTHPSIVGTSSQNESMPVEASQEESPKVVYNICKCCIG